MSIYSVNIAFFLSPTIICSFTIIVSMVSGPILFAQILQHLTKKHLYAILRLKWTVKIRINIGAGMQKLKISQTRQLTLQILEMMTCTRRRR